MPTDQPGTNNYSGIYSQYNAAQTPLTPTQQQVVSSPTDDWSDDFALKVVVQDWNYAEAYRQANHDWRFRNADEMYLAWVGQKFWEGTRIPRSSLGCYVALEQIESMLPQIMEAIFSDNPWFQCDARPGSLPSEARAVRELLMWQTEEARVREVFRRAVKSALIYGNGIVEVGWEYSQQDMKHFVQTFEPVKRNLNHPLFGNIAIPTGDFTRHVREVEYKETINRPFLRNVSIKDFYIDSNCQSPQVQDARYAITRAYKTVDELDRLRDQPGMKIPSKEELIQMATHKPTAQGDWTKSQVETNRSGWWQPSIDASKDPGAKRCEVLVYWTKERLVWTLNRQKCILNQVNPYGLIPLFNVFYTDVPDRFFGLAVTDIVEGDQRLIQAIINGRVDELSLSLHPTRIKRRGLNVPQYQLRRRPGQLIEADNPKEDIITEEVQNITQNAYIEVEAAERRVQKYTGITDLAALGAPSSGGNSASRTATGVSTQAQGTQKRMSYIVENIEDTFVEPLLNAIHTMNIRFLDPEQIKTVIGQDGQAIMLDPVSVKNARVKFSMRASAKMQARSALLQTYPLIAQTFLNPEFMNMLAQQQGKVVEVEELAHMLLDATGYRNHTGLFRPMTQQEQQQQQSPPPEMQAKLQMQREKLQATDQTMLKSKEADLANTVIGHAVDVAVRRTLVNSLMGGKGEEDGSGE